MTKKPRFIVQIETNNNSACILDTETHKIYLLVRFKMYDRQNNKEAYIHNLYEICELMNELNQKKVITDD